MEPVQQQRVDDGDAHHPAPPLRWEHILAALLLGAMALVAFVNVLGRYLFHYSLAFTEELTINLFVWLTVVGSGLAFERGAHLGVVSLYDRFPRKVRRRLLIVNAMLGTALFGTLDVLMIRTIHDEMTLFHATSPSLGLPVWIYYAGVVALSPTVFMGIYRGVRRQWTQC